MPRAPDKGTAASNATAPPAASLAATKLGDGSHGGGVNVPAAAADGSTSSTDSQAAQSAAGSSAQTQSPENNVQNALNLALAEGSDATGAAATAAQAPGPVAASAASPFLPAPPRVLPQGLTSAMQSISSTSASAAADTFALANTAGLAGDDKHTHDAAGNDAAYDGTGDGTAAALELNASASSSNSPGTTATPTFRVSPSVDSSEFPQGLAERVSYMVDSNLTSAKLQVNPPQLGPIELQIAVQGQHAQISMSTHSAVTREALESSTSTLRDMLNSQGFGQVSVDISQRSFQERPSYPTAYESTSKAAGLAPPTQASTTASRIPRSAVDAYA
jgi:flagellar hook-length control protein FliK